MEYLFSVWKELKKQLCGKFIFLFLDYDGTLASIAETPEKAAITAKNKETLAALLRAPQCRIAIISGRRLEDIKNRIGLEGIIYVGNHGLEIEGPKIKFKSRIPSDYTNLLQNLKSDLQGEFASVKGVVIEDKGLGLSLHYRQAPVDDIPNVKAIFQEIISAPLKENKIRIKSAKMALEIRPPMSWDKGKVALWFLARQRFVLKDKTSVIPLYIGDDVSDEDAFKALKDKGITIRVGGPPPPPEDSYAKYYVKDTLEVFRLLEEIEKTSV